MKTHGPRSMHHGYTVDSIYDRMREEFGFLIDYTRIAKFTFPLNLDLITRSRYLL